MNQAPIPANEIERLRQLMNYDLDYRSLENEFRSLVTLTSMIMGTPISLVNLIDSYTEWTIAADGAPIGSTPRIETACQYTIMEESHLEINDMSVHPNFRAKDYVTGEPHHRYYLGVPLRTSSGANIGSLCVLDSVSRTMEPDKIEMLKIIAEEVIHNLESLKTIRDLEEAQYESIIRQKKRAREVQDLLAGIIGVTELLLEDGPVQSPDDLHEYIRLINVNSNAIFAISRDALVSREVEEAENIIGLSSLSEKLEELLLPLAKFRKVEFDITNNPEKLNILFSKASILPLLNSPVSSIIMNAHAGVKLSIALDILVEIDDFRLSACITGTQVPSGESKAFNLAKKQIEAAGGELRRNETDECGYTIELPLRVAE